MGKSVFENTRLYENLIESNDKQEVHQKLLQELSERKISEKVFEDFKSYSVSEYAVSNPGEYIDCCIHFGIKQINLQDLIIRCIECKTLHKAYKYEIVKETIKEMIMQDGIDSLFERVKYNPQLYVCRDNELDYDDIYKNKVSQNVRYSLIKKVVGAYIMRCLYLEEYTYNTLKEYSNYTKP